MQKEQVNYFLPKRFRMYIIKLIKGMSEAAGVPYGVLQLYHMQV